MKLSILIPTLEDRKGSYISLITKLWLQFLDMDYVGAVEICKERDNGELSIGAKRQKLLERATGDYIAFVDDDDEVSPDYVGKILEAIATKPDCCSLTGLLRWPNGTSETFQHSIDFDKWEKKDGIYLRYPNHLNAVLRDLALQTGFKDMGRGEDRDYSDRLKPLLKTEVKIPGTIYYYNCRG